jgi:transcriptional regulator with XRE-family HTH domain
MKKERLARGWSVLELARRMGVDAAHLGRVESGKRPPTENLAARCDEAFPERRGWFTEFYGESRHWPEVPATFKSWPEYEDRSAVLRDWSPSIVTGLLQTEDYARALIAVQPHITSETAAARLASRLDRQQRVLGRADRPPAWFLVDELSLYRQVGTPAVMAAQLRRLLEIAAMPKVTIQVLPAVAHPVNASGFLMADEAVWVEHAASGFTPSGKSCRGSRCGSIPCEESATGSRSQQRSWKGWKAHGRLAQVLLLRRQRRQLRRNSHPRRQHCSQGHHRPRRHHAQRPRRRMAAVH